MAVGTTPDNREFLFRLQMLIIDGGTEVLRNTFDQKMQNTPLHAFLASERASINRLQRLHIITRTQYDQLYPQGGQHPNSADLDITLIICLLRNVPSLGLTRSYPWTTQPLSTDHSIEADLYRLKGFRNEIAHISSTQGFVKSTFQRYWSDIEQVLLRLNGALANPDQHLRQTIEDYRHRPLDIVAEGRFQQEIERWYEMERGLDTQMQLMRGEIVDIKREFNEKFQKIFRLFPEQRKVPEAKHKKAYDGGTGKVKRMVKEIEERNSGTNTEHTKDNASSTGKKTFTKIKKVSSEQKPTENKLNNVNDDFSGNVKNRVQQLESKSSEQFMVTKTKHLKEFQENLMVLYRRRHASISLSPLLEEEDTPLLPLYQMPTLNSVKVKWALGGGKEEKTPVDNFNGLFFKDNENYSEIYLIGDAGLGKTSFCRRLVLTWCQAKNRIIDEDKYFSCDEIRTLNRFDAAFLVTLCDSTEECDIDDMIFNQIVSRLDGIYSLEDLKNILSNTKCLVILDGLDAWTHPTNDCKYKFSDIPHRRARKWTVLTTTRPWKLSGSSVKMSEIDKKFELCGFSQDAAHNLKKAMIAHILNLRFEETLNTHIEGLNNDIGKHEIASLERNPLMLMYLICLWCDKRDLGESVSELCTNIIEFSLSKTSRKYQERRLKPPQLKCGDKHDVPVCFVKHKMCIKYYQLLEYLSNFAFDAFICGSFENSLVFDSEDEELNQSLLHFCLQTGILTQRKVRGNLTNQEKKISFVHETVHEFFTALYMHTKSDKGNVERNVISRCKFVKDILKMSKVFIFLAGINVNVFSSISRELMKVINGDNLTREYRTLSSNTEKYQSLKEFQNMCISCLKESPSCKDIKVCLQDIFIDKDCMQEEYYKRLQQLALQNKENIKSVRMIMEGIRYESENIIRDLKLADLGILDKIYYKGSNSDCVITFLLQKSVKCLALISRKWCEGKFISEPITLSPVLWNRVSSLDNLEALYISQFKMSHNQFVELVKYLSLRTSMLEIWLRNVLCTDHMTSCPGTLLDLSQHERLKRFELHRTTLSNMKLNVSSLEECRIGRLPTPELASKYLGYLPEANGLHTFVCQHPKSSYVGMMLKTLKLLDRTENVYLYHINFRDKKVPISEMKKIKYVRLIEGNMTASTFRDLVDAVQKLPQQVTVYISGCKVTPKEEFKREKETINASAYFKITRIQQQTFVFKTIKGNERKYSYT